MLIWFVSKVTQWLLAKFPDCAHLIQKAERVIQWCYERRHEERTAAAKNLKTWLLLEHKIQTDLAVTQLIVDEVNKAYDRLIGAFLDRLNARINTFLAEKLAEGVASWVSRLAQYEPKHPPDSLKLSQDRMERLQSRTNKAWQGYKESLQPKPNAKEPTVYEKEKAEEDAWG